MFLYLLFSSFIMISAKSISFKNSIYPKYDPLFHKKLFLPESEYEIETKKKAMVWIHKMKEYKKSFISSFFFLKKNSFDKRTIISMLSIWLTTITTTFPIMYDIDERGFLFP